uniref:CAPA peptides n=1 Tax=Agrotis ipsilon TaxID=56364 RepID=CAPA_AGRIP|nr:RecName: Full=CAPA peptides; Contains: RecName: Full=CAPA-periviscerokinin 1; Short=CAPA-PVK-1; Contains: RecName: Full=CAPA-periviscerokinin 2; Short=CAPA-PVK-2; Contains: RecName: Full=CAPA-periviscerokinin 3; Short=CAPA-PVK-3; Contains: RecName: Full=CAPA-trypto-pyrokinin; AltName: Full=CAPA-tryptoPK; Contains: RecName: Full=CAPA-precursor-related peptide 3; Short=CAPA-PP-3; Flags: Precursor [Agrotis ipsilon]
MQPTMRIIVSMALLAYAVASAYHSNVKLRRDGKMVLYPFPRVGRASGNTWQLPLNDLYPEYEPAQVKRQLYAFPRVGRDPVMSRLGRSDLSRVESHEFQPMAVRRTESPGMWFGPRLGRAFKNDDDEITIQNESNDHSEPEQTELIHEDRRKRQTLN